jgi:hypothetical protein
VFSNSLFRISAYIVFDLIIEFNSGEKPFMMTLLANLIINSQIKAKSCNRLPGKKDDCSAVGSTIRIGMN